jgi:putative membrane protein
MAHWGQGPAGPPPLGPEGYEWTAWHPDPTGVISFFGGLVLLLGALTGPLHDLSDYYLFSAHMVQHLLLAFAMPPLLLYGTPGWMLRPLLASPALLRLGRALTRPAGAFATFNFILVTWHLPPLYNLAMNQHAVHIVQHLMIMAAAVILWWPMLSPLPELPRAPYPVQMLYLFVVGLPMVVVSIFITMADGILYPYYAAAPRVWEVLTPHADQHLGGLIMWIPGGLVFLTAITVVFFRWQGAGAHDVDVAPIEATHGR